MENDRQFGHKRLLKRTQKRAWSRQRPKEDPDLEIGRPRSTNRALQERQQGIPWGSLRPCWAGPACPRGSKSLNSHSKTPKRFARGHRIAKNARSNRNRKIVKNHWFYSVCGLPGHTKQRLRSCRRGTDASWKHLSAPAVHQEADKTSARGRRIAKSLKNRAEGPGWAARGAARRNQRFLFLIYKYPLPPA